MDEIEYPFPECGDQTECPLVADVNKEFERANCLRTQRDKALQHLANVLAVLHGGGNIGQAKVAVDNAQAFLDGLKPGENCRDAQNRLMQAEHDDRKPKSDGEG